MPLKTLDMRGEGCLRLPPNHTHQDPLAIHIQKLIYESTEAHVIRLSFTCRAEVLMLPVHHHPLKGLYHARVLPSCLIVQDIEYCHVSELWKGQR